ncbi:MAG TPA: lysophospholipid acyltransferase family protein [Methanocorpusculum sp.]|nr:lysophospholipid acyltransferase family protein [Methanocorpusculum sp.]
MVSRALLRWYKFTYAAVILITRPYIRFIKHYSYDKVKMQHHPNVVFSNHTTMIDFLLVGVPLRKQMYFVAGEHLFRNKFLRRFTLCIDGLIIRKKGAPADDMIRGMKEVIKCGGNVWMSPEGTRSINGESAFISPATGKLVRECAELGAGLVTYRIHGGYLQSPRWAKNSRKGKMWGEFVHEYMPEELLAMDMDELNRHINEDLYVNTFDDQKKNPEPYVGKDLAENLETTLYVCPKCHRIGKLSSKGDILSCECGYKVRFTEHALFEGVDGGEVIIDNIATWDHWQRDYLKSKLPEFMAYPLDKPVDSDDRQILNKIGALKSVDCVGRGNFAIYRDRFEFQSPEKTFVFPFTDIAGFAFSLQMKILFSLKDGTYYEVNSEYPRSAFKYMVLYRYLIGKEYY